MVPSVGEGKPLLDRPYILADETLLEDISTHSGPIHSALHVTCVSRGGSKPSAMEAVEF